MRELGSRSESRNKDKIEERPKTPKSQAASVLTEEQFQTKKTFMEKAYINVKKVFSLVNSNRFNIYCFKN